MILLFTFLIVFYFQYVNKVEKNAFISQINSAVDDLTEDLRQKIPYSPDMIKIINTEIKDIKKNTNHTQIDKK